LIIQYSLKEIFFHFILEVCGQVDVDFLYVANRVQYRWSGGDQLGLFKGIGWFGAGIERGWFLIEPINQEKVRTTGSAVFSREAAAFGRQPGTDFYPCLVSCME